MAFQGDSIFWVEVEKVVPNPFQPRREFDEERLQELADSIRMYGVLQPLTVTRKEVHSDDGAFRTEYELIAGERRLRASRKAGVAQVPVIIRSGEQTEQEKLELAIIENLQREDLNAVDRALAFKQLAESFNLSHAQVAKKLGRSREYVSNSIRLLALPSHMLDGLRRGDITEGHARTLLMLKDRPEEQEVVYREILLKKLSVREVERIARKIATDKVRKQEYKDTDAHLIEIEREFTDALGTRVQILKTDFGGKLTIDYFSEDDLDVLLRAMKSQNMKISAAAMEALTPEAASVGETVIREMDDVRTDAMGALANATPLEASAPKPATEASVDQMVSEPAETQMSATVDKVEDAPINKEVEEPEQAGQTEAVTSPSSPYSASWQPLQESGDQSIQGDVLAANDEKTPAVEDVKSSVETSEPIAESQQPVQEQSVSEDEGAASHQDATVESATEPESELNDTFKPTVPTDVPQLIPSIPEVPSETSDPAAVTTESTNTLTDTEKQSVTPSYASLREKLEAELARLDALDKAEHATDEPSLSQQPQTTQSSVTPTEPAPAKKVDDDDDDLYSMRNFSL